MTSPPHGPTSNPGMTSPPDSMGSQSAAILLQRREEQNRRLLESWAAERAHLEASRARVEEVYNEERAIMDEERMLWIEEKTKLEHDLLDWKRRAEVAEKERIRMANMIKSMQGGTSHFGKGYDGAADAAIGGIRGGGPASPGQADQYRSPSEGMSPGNTLPIPGHGTTMPESNPFVPLDTRMQGMSPGATSPKTGQERVPSIDICEVMPQLEGVRLKSDAVQKPTFTDEKPLSPPASSKISAPSAAKGDSANTGSRTSPTELTKEALQAPASDRLTLHAGHTPNHSMSLSRLQTVESTVASNTANSSGTATPTNQLGEGSQTTTQDQPSLHQGTDSEHGPKTVEDAQTQNDFEADTEDAEALLDAGDEDPILKGPLFLKNRPAADEPFLQSLSDKLEHVRANAISPTVLKGVDPGPSKDLLEPEHLSKLDVVDAPRETRKETTEEDGLEEIEEEIPLKLKKSNNFGQPLGQLGSKSGSQ
ncbi:hypothetical protein F5B20DRAFT_580175 [Whalleya microplaca]|nr:hypothetical protein F5B20DRAFT_580175 [Whalleya microplaca]